MEDVLEVYAAESATGEVVGVIVQLGGQTPLGLAQSLKDLGLPVVGTPGVNPPGRGPRLVRPGAGAGRAARPQTRHRLSFDEARAIAHEIGYPVLVRPSYVLGGRGMEIVYDDEMLAGFLDRATQINPPTRC